MTASRQLSFAAGEITPELYSRVDTTRYASGLKTCRNFLVKKYGGVETRPGTTFAAEVNDSNATVRLLPFIFNSDQTYCLEFGDQYMRVFKNGAQVTETELSIGAITNANPCVLTISGHGYSNGDEVYISDVEGMTELNNRNFKVANVTGTTFSLQTMDGVDLDSTNYGTYTVSTGTTAKVYQITTPYATADLTSLKVFQSGDTVTITSKSYLQRQLTRTADNNWTLSAYAFTPDISRPNGGSASAGGAGSNTYQYRVTAIDANTGEESLVGREATQTISGATQADPCVITITSHTFNNGDEIYIDSVVGMTELNGNTYIVANKSTNTFELNDADGNNIDSTGFTAYSSAGTAARTFIYLASAAAPSSSAPHTVSWTAVSGALEYNIYRAVNEVYGLVGIAGSNSFDDIGTTPDTADTPPIERDPFSTSSDYPNVGTYFQQRLVFANTDNNVEKVEMSQVGRYNNFTKRSPTQDDDSISFTVAGRQVNEIRALLPLLKLLIMTSGGEWVAEGDSSGAITPYAINLKPYSYYGISDLDPIVSGNNALFVQYGANIVRDLAFDLNVDGYKGSDLTVFSAHLLEGYTIVDWAYQQKPDSIVWMVRSDGVLLGMTYVPEHNVIGWHRHDVDGTVENVLSIPEGTDFATYLVVKRTVDSRTVRYIERMNDRRVSDIVDFVGMDCSLSYDGRNTTTSHTMTLSGGTDWDYEESLTLTSSTFYFTSDDVGRQIHLTGSDGDVIRFTIVTGPSPGFTTTAVSGVPHKTVPASLRSTATSTWSKAISEVTGAWHLEGKNVSVFGDGFVVANPNNSAYTTVTVTDGTITLSENYAVIHVGLPITCDLETLDIDQINSETLADKGKLINEVTVFVKDSRGYFAGQSLPTTDNSLDGLIESKVRDNEDYDSPIALQTGKIETKIESSWNDNGRVVLRQTDPIPLTVLAIVPTGYIPITQ